MFNPRQSLAQGFRLELCPRCFKGTVPRLQSSKAVRVELLRLHQDSALSLWGGAGRLQTSGVLS